MPCLGAHPGGRGRTPALRVRVSASPKLTGYVTIGALFLLLGILLGRLEPAEIGIGFVAAVVIGIALSEAPELSLQARLDRDRVIEDDAVSVVLEVHARKPVPWLQLLVPVPAGIEPRSGVDVQTVGLQEEVRRTISLELVPHRWGIFPIASVIVAAHDRLGFFTFEALLHQQLSLRVFPREEFLAQAIRPLETQIFSGDEVARRKGDGIEFADVRPFESGDRVRRINWPVSTRLAKLHVNELHPERNTDVVIFLDSFSDIGSESDSTLLMAVRAAASVARYYLGRRDRVGLVSFGGTLRWQLPAMGITQVYRIVDALLSTDNMLSYAWKGIDVIPARTLPPKALVVAITPLLDERTVSALFDLRGRGFDLIIVEVSPTPFVASRLNEQEELAQRLWQLKREGLRHEFWQAGVPVTTWVHGELLATALQEVGRFRQFARASRAW